MQFSPIIGRRGLHVVLVAEYRAERLRGNQFVTEHPLARLIQIFDKGITLEVRRFGAGIVNFNPTRIVTVFIEPVKVHRRNFGNHQGGISFPLDSRVRRNIKRIVLIYRIARNRVNRPRRVTMRGNGINPRNGIPVRIHDRRRFNLYGQRILIPIRGRRIFRTCNQSCESQTEASHYSKAIHFFE